MIERRLAPPIRWLIDNPYLLLTLAIFFWSTSIIIARSLADRVPPMMLLSLRWTGASLILLPLAWGHLKRDWPVVRSDLPLLAMLAITGVVLNNFLLYAGLHFTTALNAALVQSISPLFVALWTLLLFGIPLSLTQTVGVAISMGGVIVIILRGDLSAFGQLTLNIGDVLVLLSLFVFALYSALVGRRKRVHSLSFIASVTALSVPMLVPSAMIESYAGFSSTFDASTIAAIAYIASLPSAGALLCFNRGVELIGPNRAAPFIHLMPVFGSILAITVLGEQPMLFHLAGFALVLAGVFVASRA